MSEPEAEAHLAAHHYVTLIVRMMVNDHGQLISGEMLDTASSFHERFVGEPALLDMVRRWLLMHEQHERHTRDDAPHPRLETRS
jgi:hypothetical protein